MVAFTVHGIIYMNSFKYYTYASKKNNNRMLYDVTRPTFKDNNLHFKHIEPHFCKYFDILELQFSSRKTFVYRGKVYISCGENWYIMENLYV